MMWTADDCDIAITEATTAGFGPALVGPPWHEDAGRVCKVATLDSLSASWLRLRADGLWPTEVQVVRYPVGGRFDWHVDTVLGSGRRTTIIVQLSEPAFYEGGDVEVGFDGDRLDRRRGAVSVFPVSAQHRVLPVESGERWALVAWGR